MAYIYPNFEQLEGNEKVDDGAGNYLGQCVSLVKKYTHAPPTAQWREGSHVRGNFALKPGTAIATFIKGRYPSYATGNHAAFVMGRMRPVFGSLISQANAKRSRKGRYSSEAISTGISG